MRVQTAGAQPMGETNGNRADPQAFKVERLPDKPAAEALRLPPPPKAVPELFTERIPRAEYTRRAAEVMAGLPDMAALRELRSPEVGTEIKSVFAGSQGDRIGLASGDVIVGVDGIVIEHRYTDAGRKDVQQTLHYVTAAGERRSATIQPGLIGMLHSTCRRIDLWYARNGKTDDRWDPHVLVGIAALPWHPDVAETAWHHALQAGYPRDALSDYCATMLAYVNGRTAQARELAETLPEASPASPVRLYPWEQYAVAMAAGNVPTMARAVRDAPGFFAPTNEDHMAQLLRVTRRAPDAAAPSDRLRRLIARDVIPDCHTLSDKFAVGSESQFPAVQIRLPFLLSPFLGHYRNIGFGTKRHVRDAAFRIQFKIKKKEGESRWAKILEVGLVDRDYQGEISGSTPIDSNVLKLMLEYDRDGRSQLYISHSKLPQRIAVPAPRVPMDGKQIHVIHLMRYGAWGEIFLDGRRLALVPIDEAVDNLAFFVKVVGMWVRFEEVAAWELIER